MSIFGPEISPSVNVNMLDGNIALDCNDIAVKFKLVPLMTSEKVSDSTPLSRSRLNISRLGGSVSGIKPLTLKLSAASTYPLLLMSKMASDKSLIKVLVGREAKLT